MSKYVYKHLVSNNYSSSIYVNLVYNHSEVFGITNKISTLSFFQVIKRACFDEGFPPTLVGTTAGGRLHRATASTVRLTHQSCPPCFHSISV